MIKNIIKPKFIVYWLMLGFLAILVFLPRPIRMYIGKYLGRFLMFFAKKRRHVSKVNIDLVFKNRSSVERQEIFNNFCDSIGYGLVETGLAWFRSEKYLRKISRLEADPNSLKLLQTNEPVILIGSHSTLLELGVRLLGIYVQSAGMYRPLKNPFFEEWIKYQRSRAATELIHFKDMRKVLRLLKNGENIWYALDQDMGERVGVFADFFGIKACSVNILPKLSQLTGARRIPVFIWRDKQGEYVVKILPELENIQDPVETMEQVNKVYEQEILMQVEQYFWLHRRFKNRPQGEVYPY